jgi:AcrR family transcriptional regulator
VSDSQRRRIRAGIVAVVSERGYPETRVVDVIEAAGVSRKTFYEHFEGKEHCFLTTYDALFADLYGLTSKSFESLPGAPWAERVSAALQALLAQLAANPAAARFAIVEALAAGPRALSRRDAALRRFSGFIEPGRAETAVELPGITALSLAGAVNELLYAEILDGAATRLPARLPDLVFWISLPFLGPERARAERERARPAG